MVRDPRGGSVTGANVSLETAQQTIVGSLRTDVEGRFAFQGIPPGSYLLRVTSPRFAERRIAVSVKQAHVENIEVTLALEPVHDEVTVTADPGLVEEASHLSQKVNIIGAAGIEQRAKTVVAQVASEEAGVQLQRTSPTIAGIFVRGLTGNKVNVFVDGVRYSTAAMREGINTFLDLIDPSSLEAVEILRGPNSAQYGSDAIGGSLQFVSLPPAYASHGRRLHGSFTASTNTADASYGSNWTTAFGARKFGLVANLAGRRVNTLRAGGGDDSHSVFRRFFGLRSSRFLTERLPDTAFTQYGGLVRLSWSPAPNSQMLAHYNRSQQDGGKRYDQLLGGDGNLIADLRNLMLDFFFVRFDQQRFGWFDHASVTYSFNSQREERVNQGGNGNPRASIIHQYERTRAHGIQANLGKQWGARHSLLAGAEFYHERLRAPSFGFDPTTGVSTLRRPRIPNRARYLSGGVYAQDIFEVIPQKLRLVGNVRYSAASYRAHAADSPLVGEASLWADDSLRASDFTFRAGVVAIPVMGLSLSANFSRGFRAPHMTDLGTLGLTGSGFEVAAPDVAGQGATVGSRASSDAVSTGLAVVQVRPETSLNYEVGARYRRERIDVALTFFVNDLSDIIAKQALILPPGAVGLTLGGEPIIAQNPNGVVFVALSSNPVLVRTNFGDARIYGFEHTLTARPAPAWSVGGGFTYLHAQDQQTGLPPNIEGGTPGPDGFLKIRYEPGKSRWWIEPYVHMAGRQDRLSSLDLEDRRTGALRTRASIRSFFLNGATARGLVGPSLDGLPGTADDVLLATGETLAQIEDRVLGVGVDSSPLFKGVPGYITFNVRGGIHFGEQHEVLLDFENIGDRNYRGISWGLDAPGRSLLVRYTWRF